jgi:mRNA-degrading endonuclease RelE of RelBE toxin-antitoxin system
MAFIRELDPRQRERLKLRLGELEFDPFRARPKADIKNCGKHHGMVFYRLRIGDFRAVYVVEGNDVKVTEIFRRGRGYRWVD